LSQRAQSGGEAVLEGRNHLETGGDVIQASRNDLLQHLAQDVEKANWTVIGRVAVILPRLGEEKGRRGLP